MVCRVEAPGKGPPRRRGSRSFGEASGLRGVPAPPSSCLWPRSPWGVRVRGLWRSGSADDDERLMSATNPKSTGGSPAPLAVVPSLCDKRSGICDPDPVRGRTGVDAVRSRLRERAFRGVPPLSFRAGDCALESRPFSLAPFPFFAGIGGVAPPDGPAGGVPDGDDGDFAGSLGWAFSCSGPVPASGTAGGS